VPIEPARRWMTLIALVAWATASRETVWKATAIDGMIVLPSPSPITNRAPARRAYDVDAPTCVRPSVPTLLARERKIVGRYGDALAALIAEETGAAVDDLRPRVAAGALMAVHRALIDYARRRALSGHASSRLAADLEAEGRSALALLAEGLDGYAVKADDARHR
jgi:hypothetical protein